MFVSILQLMGFPKALPVHSRAVEVPNDHVQKDTARRPEVKASTGKNIKAKAVKSNAKSTAKPAAKSVGKAVPVKSHKVVTKPTVKPASKVAPKKAIAKKVSAVKLTVAKKAVKAPAKAIIKAPVKAVAKVIRKSAAKKPAELAAKPTPKAPAKATKPKAPVAAQTVKATPVAPEKKSMPVSSPPAKASSAPVVPAAPAVPAKAGRPSSRLAQLTVPSMAQAVASTAAKASYTQTMPSPVIAPVLPMAVKKDPKLVNNWKSKSPAELSDAELMAMPDAEYMNEVQMAAFRLKLATLKRDILSNAGETTEHLREDTSVTPDPADRATIEEEHALELRTRDRERKLLKKIEQSIARIDAGDYGYCDETGEPIGVGRLLARPTATLSLEAQQRRELKQKMFGD